ncbi:MAG: cytochrome c oxidase subunit II [Bdellovibrionia bacterium]
MFNEAFAASTVPLQGTDIAVKWDSLYNFLVGLSIFFFILVIGGMLVFIYKYRHKPGVKTQYMTDSHLLEGLWVGVPTALLMGIFVWGYSVYHSMKSAPSDAYEIRVLGKQWLWTFQYDDGRTTVNEVYVPVNRPVKLVMTSEDVLHGFFVPNFRIKQDVVPGMYSSIWFTATVPGKHQVFCTEYCGTSHSGMLAKVIALSEDQWEAWVNHKKIGDVPEAGMDVAATDSTSGTSGSAMQKPTLSLVEQGRVVYETKGCVACHSTDGTNHIGPTHKGLYGSKVELANGKTVVADENYIRDHIENPASNTVKGYNPVMPTFKGLITEAEMNALIAYIKSLK